MRDSNTLALTLIEHAHFGGVEVHGAGNRATSVWGCHPSMTLNSRSHESLKVSDHTGSYTSTQRSLSSGSHHFQWRSLARSSNLRWGKGSTWVWGGSYGSPGTLRTLTLWEASDAEGVCVVMAGRGPQIPRCPSVGVRWLSPPCPCTTAQFLFISGNVKEQVNCTCMMVFMQF